ncbi:hypothetical protein BU16DRAFT_175446 [Lophium mytilinum]|uniref:Uncharacterized protein n=1 Tax=Lophium mytilinum TaxID=390894 RepID=A0A6A6QAL1_9PEZI|nr:hypothetical protein BU16DRAFT_175446 [Lophium mytilinum]
MALSPLAASLLHFLRAQLHPLQPPKTLSHFPASRAPRTAEGTFMPRRLVQGILSIGWEPPLAVEVASRPNNSQATKTHPQQPWRKLGAGGGVG